MDELGQKEQNGQKEHVSLEFESHSKNEEFSQSGGSCIYVAG